MSLELTIAEATRAINQLIAILREQSANPVLAENSPAIAAPAAEDPPKTKRAKKEAAPAAPVGEPVEEATAPSPAATATDTPAVAAAATDTPAVAAAATATEPPTYGEVAPYITRVAKTLGKAPVLELLGKFKAAHFSQVDTSDYAAVLAAAKEMLGE
jgi:hypothetical protein